MPSPLSVTESTALPWLAASVTVTNRPRRGKLDCVRQQVVDHLLDAHRVSVDPDVLDVGDEFVALRPLGHAQRLDAAPHESPKSSGCACSETFPEIMRLMSSRSSTMCAKVPVLSLHDGDELAVSFVARNALLEPRWPQRWRLEDCAARARAWQGNWSFARF